MVMADMTAALLPLLAQLLCTQVTPVLSHARFLEPPSRASMWRMGFEAPVDYQDHEGSCGGLFYQWLANGGRCGICGDRWDDWPRPHERGGRFATGGIVRRYRRGQIISTVVEVTTAHRGYMEFRICELSRERPEATQPCLNRHLLRLADGSGTKYRVGEKSEMARVKLRLPADLTCAHCVIQWRYRTGNNWGICPDGSSQLGCGPQEEFRGCSDVAVLPRNSDTEFSTVGPATTSTSGRPRVPSDLTGPSGGLRGPPDLTAPSGGLRGPPDLTAPSGSRRRPPPSFSGPSAVAGPSSVPSGTPLAGLRRPSDFASPSLPSRRPSVPRPMDFNQLPEITGPSSAQTFRPRPSVPRRPSDLIPEVTAPSALPGSLSDPRRRPPRPGYHHRPYEAMTARNRTRVTTGTRQVSSSDDFDDEFIDLDNNFIDVDGNVVDDSDTSDGFIDSDEPFVDVDDLEEVDLRDLESLGVGDIPTAFDGDNTIDGSSDDPFRSAGLRRGKQLGGLSPSDRECHAVGVWVTVPGMDAWCHTNCLAEPEPSCPEGMCQCGEAGAAPARPSLQLLQGSLPSRPAAALPTPASPSR
ncbi:hypothetical protein FJT64_026749 [Amphibalanus amphitrite]|uniref:Chitin-binding type-4 domain-containing protein n=1 Tax=Amphibalanus amphitrite TaxID=1232801 RepID=A0A6A4WFN2_AMPAM|nr:hypothetical protein FJT64_026749 [Amphibalanus amphitrite]